MDQLLLIAPWFVLGIFIGSFLNVVLMRIEQGESFVGGRSRCDNCRTTILWYDNIPLLSFLFLRGQCRVCAMSISWQHVGIEFLTGLLFAVATLLFPFSSTPAGVIFQVWLLASLSLIVLISVYDLRHLEIPTLFLWAANVSTLVFILLFSFFDFHLINAYFPASLEQAFLGALTAGGFLWLLVFLSQERWMGWGDVWLGTWGGMVVGFSLVQLFITFSFVYGAVIGVLLLLIHKKTLKAEIPFAPYLLLGMVTIFLLLHLSPGVFSFLLPWFPGTIE
jgi:leader peptidase (prepilin peptidase)/N-methyltransferase